MKANKTYNKRHLIFLGCFFVCVIVSAQQNITGLKGSTGELLRVELFRYSDIQNSSAPDTVYEFDLFSFYSMHSLGYDKLNDIAKGTLRFEGNSIYASTLGSPESLITVDVQKPFNPQTGEYGAAVLTYNEDQMQNIDFYNIEGVNIWIVRYFFDERTEDNEHTYLDNSRNLFANTEDTSKYRADNFGYDSDYQNMKITEDQEIKMIKPKKRFLVLIHYKIK
jgi:hypothetical protein